MSNGWPQAAGAFGASHGALAGRGRELAKYRPEVVWVVNEVEVDLYEGFLLTGGNGIPTARGEFVGGLCQSVTFDFCNGVRGFPGVRDLIEELYNTVFEEVRQHRHEVLTLLFKGGVEHDVFVEGQDPSPEHHDEPVAFGARSHNERANGGKHELPADAAMGTLDLDD